ncbi:MAG: alpha/beta fold hydrolase [Candidatus Krumholzibacteriia bacterium]
MRDRLIPASPAAVTLAALTALTALAALAPAASAAPLPVAGDFEQASADRPGPAGWVAGPRLAEGDLRAAMRWVEDEAHSGRRSVSISLDPSVESSDIAYNWTTTVEEVRAGASYAASAWVKTAELNSPASLILQCWNEANDEMLAFATTAGSYRLAGDTDWTRIWTIVTVPEGAARLMVRAVNVAAPGKGGTIWFDDVELHAVDDALGEGPAALEGAWHGVLQVAATGLNVILHVDRQESGWAFSLDSPDQSANGMPVVDLDLRDGEASFRLANIPAGFAGRLTSPDQLAGEWRQVTALPLVLTRLAAGETAPARRRPQEPTPPYPYASEEVSYEVFPADGAPSHVLHGTLVMPAGDGPHPAVLLVSGSGPQDRDETIFGHRPFLVLADHLARRGLAVLRVDDRGVGQSTGARTDATTADFAEDALAGVRYLRSRAEIAADRVAVLGHSEGGLIAPMVAVAEPAVAAIVLMAGPGVPGREILELQQRLILEAAGAAPEKIAAAQADQEALMSIALADADSAARAERVADHLRGMYARLSAEERAEAGPEDTYVRLGSRQMLGPWMRWFLVHDPRPVLREVRCPVLAVNGSLDVQVDADQNLPAIATALDEGRNPDHVEVVLPGLNHLMQPAKTGGIEEYADIELTLAPVFLDTVTSWLQARLGVTTAE